MKTVVRKTRPIKILRLITRLNIGGPSIQAVTLSADLPGERFSTTLVCGQPGPREGDMSYLAKEIGIKPILIPSLQREVRPAKDLLSLFRIIALLRRERPDILHTHMSKAGAVGRIAAIFFPKVKTVHTFHGHVLSGYFSGLLNRIYLFIERWLARHTDKLVALSDSQKRELLDRFQVGRPDGYTVIPLGFDLDRFVRSEALKGGLRKELSIPPEAAVIATVGRLAPIKDHELFLEVVSLVLAERRDVLFLVVGDGPKRMGLEEKTRTMGLSRSVIFLGWRKNVERVYADADIILLTSRSEGTPVSLIEAAASGKPVVATDVGGVADVVRDGISGLLVGSRDPREFAQKVLELLKDQPRCEEMGGAGRSFVLERYSKDRLLRDTVRMYDDLQSRG